MSDLHLYSVLDTLNNLDKVEESTPAETVYETVEARGSITRAIKEAGEKKKDNQQNLGQSSGISRGLTGDPQTDKLLTKVRTDYPAIAAKSDMEAIVKHVANVDDELERAKAKEDELQKMLQQNQAMLAQNQENQDEMNNRFKELNAQIASGEISSKDAAKKAQDIDKDYQTKKKKSAPNAKAEYTPPSKAPTSAKVTKLPQPKIGSEPKQPAAATTPTAPSNVVPIRPTADPFGGDGDGQGELKFGESLDLGPEVNDLQPDPGVLARARWEQVRKAWYARQPEVSIDFPDRPGRPVTIRAAYMYALAWYFRETGDAQDELARIEKTMSSYAELQKVMNSPKLSQYLSVYPEFVKKDKVLKAARARQRELRKQGQQDMFGNKLQEGVEALSKSLMEKFQNFKQEETLLERELKDKEDFDKHAKTGDHYTTKSGNKVIKTKTGIKHEKVEKKSKDEKDDLDEAKEKPMNAFHPDFTKKEREKEGTGKFDKKKISTGTVYTKKSEKPDFLDLDDDGDKEEPMKKAAKDKKAKAKSKKKVKETAIAEKAVSKAQQKFMGMVYATKKGEKAPSSAVAKAAKGMSKSDARDFAKTKHKGLPQNVGEGVEFTDTIKNSSPKMKKITVKESADALRKQPIYTTQEAWDHYAQELEEEKMKMEATADQPVLDAQQELDEIARLAGLPAKAPVAAEEATCLECGMYESECGCDHSEELMGEAEVEEGNEFSGALAAAKAAGEKEFEVDGKKYTVKEDININVSANGEEDVVNLIRKLSGMPVLAIQTPTMGEAVAEDAVENTLEGGPTVREIEHTNTPREEVAGLDAATPDGADLNRAKKSFKKEYPGDNPMAVKEAALWKAYESMLKDVKD